MKKIAASLFMLIGILLLALQPLQAQNSSSTPQAYVLEVKGVISPATKDLISRHLKKAAAQNADIVILEMHTPGGLYQSTQDIIQEILDSPVPVATYVSPAGSHAASAGTYILYASHIAAMSPGTNIGAATPIQMGGQETPQDSSQGNEEPSGPKETGTKSTLESKMVNDAAAYIRGLAELRDRNLKWAESAVREAESLTASEAAAKKVIDTVADNIPALLDSIDGKTVKMAHGSTKTLNTKGARIENHAPDWRHELLNVITHPNVAFLLMTLGFYGLVYEFAHPGAMVPGVVGGICLLLGLYAMNILPINYAGLALLFVGLCLMTAEAFTPSFGALGIGGAVAFAFGSTMLIDSDLPGYGIDPWLIAALTVSSIGLLSLVLAFAVKAQRKPKVTGVEELLAATGEVVSWSKGTGEVRVTGEIWQATADADSILKKGDNIKVTAINGLCLTVIPNK